MYWTQDRLRFKRLVKDLTGQADAHAEAEIGAPLDPRLADTLELVMAGEEQLGLETLCANILDYRVRLTDQQYATILDLAQQWTWDIRLVERLTELVIRRDVTGPTSRWRRPSGRRR